MTDDQKIAQLEEYLKRGDAAMDRFYRSAERAMEFQMAALLSIVIFVGIVLVVIWVQERKYDKHADQGEGK